VYHLQEAAVLAARQHAECRNIHALAQWLAEALKGLDLGDKHAALAKEAETALKSHQEVLDEENEIVTHVASRATAQTSGGPLSQTSLYTFQELFMSHVVYVACSIYEYEIDLRCPRRPAPTADSRQRTFTLCTS
jgi:hypothetical protein